MNIDRSIGNIAYHHSAPIQIQTKLFREENYANLNPWKEWQKKYSHIDQMHINHFMNIVHMHFSILINAFQTCTASEHPFNSHLFASLRWIEIGEEKKEKVIDDHKTGTKNVSKTNHPTNGAQSHLDHSLCINIF